MVTIGDLENNEIESIHIEGITNIPLIKGEQGEKGDKGDKGETNNIKIGTVETGEKASATLEGESPNQILNLVLPKGDKGEQGEPGIKPVKGIDYFTEEEIQEIKSNILDQVNQFSVLVVEELPTDNIDEHTIYFVPKTKTEQNDVYDEFIYINNGWEHIGTTEVDLSSYYKKDEIDTKLEAVEGNEVFVGNEEPTAGEKVWFNKNKNSIYVRNSNGVYEEFAKKSEGLVDYTSYIEFNDKVTKIYNCTAYKKDNILFLNIDLGGNFPEGETLIGTIKRKLKLTAFGSGRLRTTNNKIIPATYIGLSEGAFRVHTTTTGTATTGNIILALEE